LICLNYIVLPVLKFLVLLLKKQEILDKTYPLLQAPCFNKFDFLFYNNKVKIVPLNIGEMLTKVVLYI